MQIRLPQTRGPVVTVFGGVLVGAFLAGAGPQMDRLWDRPSCAETVMKAVSTDKTVSGSYGCFDTNLQTGLQTIGIDSDNAFALKVGQNGEYHYVHKTADGGYVYEYDRPTRPHDKVQGAISALGLWSVATFPPPGMKGMTSAPPGPRSRGKPSVRTASCSPSISTAAARSPRSSSPISR